MRDALNAHLRPHPVAVIAAEKVSDAFDARFSALKRHYLYRIINRRADLTFERGRAWRIAKPLNSAAMHAAAQRLVGHHDFTTFRHAECQAKSPFKTLDQLDVNRVRDDVHIAASARSFLHTQVRSMVAAGQYEIPATNTAYGDPVPNVVKQLRIDYELDGKPHRVDDGACNLGLLDTDRQGRVSNPPSYPLCDCRCRGGFQTRPRAAIGAGRYRRDAGQLGSNNMHRDCRCRAGLKPAPTRNSGREFCDRPQSGCEDRQGGCARRSDAWSARPGRIRAPSSNP